jgi:hypothetical protein
MKLDETDQIIKDKINEIMSGEWDSNFEPEQLHMLKRRSFLLNNISKNDEDITFEWNGDKINVHCGDILELNLYLADTLNHVVSSIMSDPVFINAYNTFSREWKIDGILENKK